MTNSRRNILKITASIGASLTVPWVSTGHANEDPDFDVIVIGAGMAGLYATKQLLAKGHSVKVLEASDRHGGRIYSKTLGQTRIEMGAEEHYLRKNNPLYDAITGVLGEDAYVRTYDRDSLLSIDAGKTCWEESGDCYEDADIGKYWDYLEIISNASEQNDFSKTMADDVLERYGVGKNHRAYHLYDNAIANSIYGTSLENIGIASLAAQEQKWTLSEGIRVLSLFNTGYLDVLDQIWWNDILDHVSLSTPVAEVDTSGEHIRVTDSNGNVVSAKKIIITVSIGVLQSQSIRFTPQLPEATVKAYNNIGMGKGMKVALRFKEKFWDSKMTYFISEGLASNGWVPTSYKKESPDNIIMCYPMGRSAETLIEIAERNGGGDAGDIAITQAILEDLSNLISSKASELYIDAVVQNWASDPFVRGSYSHPTLETYASSKNYRQQLAEPVGGRIFFAGEATNNKNSATVPGALQEGERAAQHVDTLLKS